MKTSHLILSVLGITVCALTSCNHREKRPEQIDVQMLNAKEKSAAAEESLENETDYKTQSEARLYENARDIALLKSRSIEPAKKAREKPGKNKSHITTEKELNVVYKKRIDSLEHRNNELRARLNSWKEKDKAKWSRFRKEFSGDLDQLRQALKDIGNTNAEDDSKN